MELRSHFDSLAAIFCFWLAAKSENSLCLGVHRISYLFHPHFTFSAHTSGNMISLVLALQLLPKNSTSGCAASPSDFILTMEDLGGV